VDALLALDALCWQPGTTTWNSLTATPYAANIANLRILPSRDGAPAGASGSRYGSFLFMNTLTTVAGLNIGPAANPELTMEIWVRRVQAADNREWVLGHDNGGYDRALSLNDDRFGGVYAQIGAVGASTLGVPPLGAWKHIVGVWRQGGEASSWMNGQKDVETTNANNNEGMPDMTIGGLANFAGHEVFAEISQVRVYGRALSDDEVMGRFASTRARYNV